MTFIEWCFKAHRDTNHNDYGGYLPYEFHLRMVMKVATEFWNIMRPDALGLYLCACAGHDLIEDTRKSYNDVLQALIQCDEKYTREIAGRIVEMIFAVSNETGRNRPERANDHYYWKIRHTPGAKFVKMCDKIANVRYGIWHDGSKLDMHKKEHEYFLEKMQLEPVYKPMLEHLNKLLSN